MDETPGQTVNHEDAERLKREANAKLKERLLRLFSTNQVVREDAQQALRESWCHDLPSFRPEELADFPANNCSLLAAQRDGNKEVVNWLIGLSNSVPNT